jgi:hypothetical protein
VRIELVLPETASEIPEPILETGSEIDRRDGLEIGYLPDRKAAISYFHSGSPVARGKVFDVPANGKVVVEARFGSLLPPFDHPAFCGWSKDGYEIAKHNVRITVNGAEVLRSWVDGYESSPAYTRVGRFGWPESGKRQAYSGIVRAVERLPLVKPPSAAPSAFTPEPLELSLLLPAAGRAGSDPLLLTGRGSESDLLYCIYDGADHVSFALDHFGAGGPRSATVAYDPLVPHTLTAWMGSLWSSGAIESKSSMSPDRLVVALDASTLLNIHQAFYPGSPNRPIVGLNAGGSTEAGREYTGEILGIRRVATSALRGLDMSGGYGFVEMNVSFPRGVAGTQEPLAVTGVPGAGDFAYIRYAGENTIAIGFDHWGIGGILGNPIAVDYNRPHRLWISFQSLYSPDSIEHESEVVRVLVDGQPALVARFPCFPSDPEQVEVGRNLIGGSTCGQWFTGNIMAVRRRPGTEKW